MSHFQRSQVLRANEQIKAASSAVISLSSALVVAAVAEFWSKAPYWDQAAGAWFVWGLSGIGFGIYLLESLEAER